MVGAFADFLIEFMSESNETEMIDDEILHQLEESLGKDTLEKQLHRRDSHNPKAISPQVSILLSNSYVDSSNKLNRFSIEKKVSH